MKARVSVRTGTDGGRLESDVKEKGRETTRSRCALVPARLPAQRPPHGRDEATKRPCERGRTNEGDGRGQEGRFVRIENGSDERAGRRQYSGARTRGVERESNRC